MQSYHANQTVHIGCGRLLINSSLPSEEQVKSFVEGLATVALIALLIFGAAAGANISADAYAPIPPKNTFASPPAIVRPIGQGYTAGIGSTKVQEINLNNGISYLNDKSFAEMLKSNQKFVINNQSTGTRYEVEDGRVRGTDGSRYRVLGNRVYGSNGEEFYAVGNKIHTRDGRSCQVYAEKIRC